MGLNKIGAVRGQARQSGPGTVYRPQCVIRTFPLL